MVYTLQLLILSMCVANFNSGWCVCFCYYSITTVVAEKEEPKTTVFENSQQQSTPLYGADHSNFGVVEPSQQQNYYHQVFII